MKREWKLWPWEYGYRFHNIIWGIGFDLFIAVFVINSIIENTKYFIGDKAVTLSEFLIPVCGILLIGLFIAALGIIKNVRVYRLRKELKVLKDSFKCYDGTISSIERIQANEIVQNQADNIHNRHTHVFNKVVVDYIDEDGRKRIATSDEYSEYLSALLKDNKAKVYVSKNGNNRIVDELSWRQSSKDGYINVPGEEMKDLSKRVYYRMLRWKEKIEVLALVIVILVIIILIL